MRTDKIVAVRLKQARLRAEMTQEQLGVKAGIDEMTASARMNQYERAVHLPKPFMLGHMARVLNVPLPYFYTVDDELAEAIWLFGRMSRDAKAKALSTLRQLCGEKYKET